MAGSLFSVDTFGIPVALIGTALEQLYNITMLDGVPGSPGQLRQLPDDLGGDPAQWADLEGAAIKSDVAFFELLRRKAHFLALPTTIVEAMKPKVRLVEMLPPSGSAGETILNLDDGTVEIHILAASIGVTRIGYDFGREVRSAPPGSLPSYAIMEKIYHEMAHAWFDVVHNIFADTSSPVGLLFAQGTVAYKSATGVSGTSFSDRPDTAFSEAMAYYVGDRISRWFAALSDLDFLWSVKPTTNDPATVAGIIATYDDPKTIYGKVFHDGAFDDIASPPISDELRAGINEKVLDGLPLGKPFAQTPLADLSNALLARPVHH